MAKLKETYVSGNLWITGSSTFVSASEFRGPLNGTASIANNLNPSNSYTVQDLTVGGVGGASGSAHIHGDLKVDGDLIYVGVQDLRVKDKTIELNANESGSAVQDADGAGIIIRNSSAEGDISILYDKASDSLVINKPISGSMTRAATASVAEKVKFALSFGTGISKSAASYNGSAGVTISLDTASVKSIKVNSASKADTASVADTAHRVDGDLSLYVSHSDNGVDPVFVAWDGTGSVSGSINLAPLENTASAHSASIADIYDTLADITGSGTGSVEQQIQAAIETLDSTIDLDASLELPVSGGVLALQSVTIVERDGKLIDSFGEEPISTYNAVEVEKAGAAAKVSASLKDFTAISASVKRLETSASVLKSTASVHSASIADIYSTLAEITGSGTGSVEQQIQAALNELDAEVSLNSDMWPTPPSGGVWAMTAVSFSQIDGQVDANADAEADFVEVPSIDKFVKVSSSFVSISASVKRLETSASVIKSTYTTTASFNAYTSSANGRLSKLESASASLNTFTSSANGRLSALESSSASLDNEYIKKMGDVVSGSLTFHTDEIQDRAIVIQGQDEDYGIDMNNTAIIFGNMKVFYNYADNAIEFAPTGS